LKIVDSSSRSRNAKNGAFRWLGFFFVMLVLMLGWGAAVATGTLNGWFRTPLAPAGDVSAFAKSATRYLERENRGNVAFVLIENGVVVDEHFASRGKPVDRDTRFQVASLSKWLTAWGILRLADEGKVDLDAPVSRYITRWRLPDGPFDESQVTVRRLLSHTAGLTDELGYGGFAPGKSVPSLVESLTRTVDSSPGADGRVRVGIRPGEEFLYSGGGYALLQLIIEDVSGEPFDAFMTREIFKPLGMDRSGFIAADADINVAESFDTKGKKEPLYNFAAPAASSLYTTAGDLTRFIQAHKARTDLQPAGRGVLGPEMLAEMQKPHAQQYGADIWGLGVVLYAPDNRGGFIIGHDGTNEPAINTTARVDPVTGSGIIVLETGQKAMATRLGGEWVFWKTGNVDLFDVLAAVPGTLRILLGGFLLIIVGGSIFAVRSWRRRRNA
jgi:CubicO group peptidase (beta-lactamase class C family)